jgi:GTP pyrophosphokinase
MNVNIHRVRIQCDQGIFDGTIELRIHDRQDVATIVENLKNVNGLQEINQII